jgi:hypothetical protein
MGDDWRSDRRSGAICAQSSTGPPKFDDFVSQDQAFAEMCCRGDDQCLDDLHVKLSGCLAEHRKDGTWDLCQYQYMEQLGIKPPRRTAAGILEDGNPQPTAEQLRQDLDATAEHWRQARDAIDQMSPSADPAEMARWLHPPLPAYMAGVCKGESAIDRSAK